MPTHPTWKPNVPVVISCIIRTYPKDLKKPMSTLKDHFGENAELDAKAKADIEKFLTATVLRTPQSTSTKIFEIDWFHRNLLRISDTPF